MLYLRHPYCDASPKAISGRTSYLLVRLAFHPYPQLIRYICNCNRFGPPTDVTPPSPWSWIAHQVSCLITATARPLQTRFRFGSGCFCLNLATAINSLAHSPKGTRSQSAIFQLLLLLPPSVGERFQVLFHSPHRGSFHLSLTVLVLYRSSGVFSLGEWSPQFPTELACSVVLRLPTHDFLLSPTGLSPAPVGLSSSIRLAYLSLSVDAYNPDPLKGRFGLLRFRSPLLAESFLFLWVLRCFSSPGSLPLAYVFSYG